MRSLRWLLVSALALTGTLALTGQHHAAAATTSTSQFRGVNWADQRDNFVNGVLYPSGLSSSDTYSSAATVADRVVGQLFSISGANTVRLPVNEPTVSTYWGTYTGAIDTALTKGNVIFAYWAYTGGRPTDTNAFYAMWDKIVGKYGSNPNAYFEVINEPYGYSSSDLNNMYNTWLNRYSSVPRGQVILDGTGDATNISGVGGDSRLANTLLAVHYYTFFAGTSTNESDWANGIAGEIGQYASRTVATEWGAPMSPGSKNGVHYDTINYDVPGGNFFDAYVRGVSSELRTLGVGSVYWPGLRDGDWYSLTSKTGTGASIALTLVNASGLDRLKYAWGTGNGGGGGGTYVQIRDVASGLCVDGLGRTTVGANAGQSGCVTGDTNQEWTVVSSGSYVRIQNRATGLFLDGMGRTANGSAAGQYSSSTSNNQQWTEVSAAGGTRFQNRATGLYLDGMGRTANGSDLGQYSSSSSTNQQWQIATAS
ncbi:MAG: RICIN domain-containing protein [Catenulispora sp.]